MKSSQSLLVADIGGTNIRIALADPASGRISDEMEFKCSDFSSAQSAIWRYLEVTGTESPDVMCLAIAAPVVGETFRFTNNNWSINSTGLRQEFATTDVRVINDFEAIAMALPTLAQEGCLPIGTGHIDLQMQNFTVGVLGPGTGLGGCGLLRRNSRDTAVISEAGHGSIATENSVQQEIISLLKKDYGRVSCERLLSGPGIENIYRCLGRIRGESRQDSSASLIGENARTGADDIARETIEIFFEMLGQVAGDFALMIGAFEGVFIAGGIARRYTDMLQNSRFRSGFENKGRYQSLMRKIPTELITHAQPGLLGAGVCAVQMAQARIVES